MVLFAYELPSTQVPIYRLSSGSWTEIERIVLIWFEAVSSEHARPSDLQISRLARSFHFGVLGRGTLVHADLRLGRVVEAPWSTLSAGDDRVFRLVRK